MFRFSIYGTFSLRGVKGEEKVVPYNNSPLPPSG